jgi:serine/threonine-protein kinase HipA
MTRAEVWLWGKRIGAVVWDPARALGVFEYDPDFVRSGIQVAPLKMPLRAGVHDFPGLPQQTFHGLPGLLADSLPDKFGNLLINRWLAEQGRAADSMNPVERLCYIGSRGMGALEFRPARSDPGRPGKVLDIEAMVNLASAVLQTRENLAGTLRGEHDEAVMRDILRVGTSAGGARAKAVLSWNPATGEFRSGQLPAAEGFEPWLLKFDGVSGNADKELADPAGFGRLEYACHLLATEAGVQMMPCRLHEEGGRAHFMTRRFDRSPAGRKWHLQSLGAMRHFDFNQPRAYAYEQAIETIRLLDIGPAAIEQQARRAFLNVVIRNQDDHVKNIAFVMNQSGAWALSPAFDVTYAYNPEGTWTREHQMSLNGRTSDFSIEDLISFGRYCDLKPARCRAMIDEVLTAARNWRTHCDAAGVPEAMAERAYKGFRLGFEGGA